MLSERIPFNQNRRAMQGSSLPGKGFRNRAKYITQFALGRAFPGKPDDM